MTRKRPTAAEKRERPAHTPGPWLVEPFIVEGEALIRLRVVSKSGRVVCGLAPGLPLEEWQANAHVLAAAPRLLAALQPFVEHNCSDETITITVRTADVAEARAAIAEASA